MPGQTVQTQIRLLLEEQSDQGLQCLPFRLHRLDSLLYIFRKLTVRGFACTNRQLNYKGINHKLENGVLEILEYHIHTCHKLWTETCETRQTFTVCFK